MAAKSLFSILADSPWWISVLTAALLFFVARVWLPDIAAVAAAAPFLVIAGYAGWRQLRTPGAARVARQIGELRALPWERFSALVIEGLRRQGYAVVEVTNDAIDLELRRQGRLSVVCCRRWKVAQTGIGPLRDLHAAMRELDAHECVYISAGAFTDQARKFADQHSVRLLGDIALCALLGNIRISPAPGEH